MVHGTITRSLGTVSDLKGQVELKKKKARQRKSRLKNQHLQETVRKQLSSDSVRSLKIKFRTNAESGAEETLTCLGTD